MRNTGSMTYWTVSFSKEALETLKFPSTLLKLHAIFCFFCFLFFRKNRSHIEFRILI